MEAIRISCYTSRNARHVCSVLCIVGLFTLHSAANKNTEIPQYQWMVKRLHSQSYVWKPYAMTLCLRNVSWLRGMIKIRPRNARTYVRCTAAIINVSRTRDLHHRQSVPTDVWRRQFGAFADAQHFSNLRSLPPSTSLLLRRLVLLQHLPYRSLSLRTNCICIKHWVRNPPHTQGAPNTSFHMMQLNPLYITWIWALQ